MNAQFNRAKQLIEKYGPNWASHVSELEAQPRPELSESRQEAFQRIANNSFRRLELSRVNDSGYRAKRPLTDEELMRYAPSIFAEKPWRKMSKKYRFIPTIKVINAMRKAGIHPVTATQSTSRIEGKGNFTKHSIRFRFDTGLLEKGEVIPEIQLVNSHDGTASYRLYLGIYRCFCANQCTVEDKRVQSIRVIHRGGHDLCREVINASFKLAKKANIIMDRINDWRKIELNQAQQLDFATKALDLYKSSIEIQPERLLWTRRNADRANDLWTVFNKIQEHVIKGGMRGRTTTGRRTSARAVKSIDRNLDLNLGLWRLADTIAQG
jgi:hypothetical protein